MEQPMVAVVVPVCNRLGLLKQTVASLAAQDLAGVEFILVDDHSDVATVAWMAGLVERDHRFRVVHKPEGVPRGCQVSRNLGLDACRAEAVVFLDSDDLLTEKCLSGRWSFLVENPGVDVVVGLQAMFWEGDEEIRWVNVPLAGVGELDRCLDLMDPLDVPWVNGGVMMRVEALRRRRLRWPVRFHWDDLAFHFSCLISGMRVGWMERNRAVPDSFYRKVSEGNYGSVLQTAEGARNTAEMIAWMKGGLEEAGMWNRARREALLRSFFHRCVLAPVDRGEVGLALEMAEFAYACGLAGGGERSRMRGYVRGRGWLGGSPRGTYYWNRSWRRCGLRSWFRGVEWTYGSVAAPAPESGMALARLLALAGVG